jgi:alkylation response protein AidB-like acyl-CoA dehydrogenase
MHPPTEAESRKLAEESRQKEWKHPSFLRELFLGNFRLDHLPDYPSGEFRPGFAKLYKELRVLLTEKVDPVAIDETGEYPKKVLHALAGMGAFGLLVPKEFGGHGITKIEWCHLMELVGSYDGNLVGLLSPHQAMGVPETIKQFGTPEQKQKYLPRCAAGEISAFALSEPDVGSDPARLQTTARLSPDGETYVLNGVKLWCTNGTLAKLFIVMARDAHTKRISAFVVDADSEGVTVAHRCRFMGLRALSNGVIRFKNVRVPPDNIVGGEGNGLRVALSALNVGRLSVPAGAVGAAKKCLEISRRWGSERVQWGKPIGKHETIAHKIADMASAIYAMESMLYTTGQMCDRGEYDTRLETAAVKEWNTSRSWEIVDETFQIRGGRGYETERSLSERGEEPIPVERMMRDTRITKVFEGTSEILHLLMAREAVDKHLQVAGVLLREETSKRDKLRAIPQIAAFYARWYLSQWFDWGYWPRYDTYGRLGTHLRFIRRSSRRLARQVFHGMVLYGGRLQYKQAFLFRLVDIGMELFAMASAVSRAHTRARQGHPDSEKALDLVDVFCSSSRRKVKRLFLELWHNDDDAKYRTALQTLAGEHTWLERGILAHDEALFPASLRSEVHAPGHAECAAGEPLTYP